MPERNYTNSEVRSMQQDAIQRVMEMQRIANERLQHSNAVLTGRQEERPQQPEPAPRRQEAPPQNRRQPPPRGRGESRGSSPSPTHHAMPVKLEGPAPEHPPAPAPSPFSSGALEGFIHRLGLETDQLILIGLLLLLINEGADTTLILAVFYLLI